ncbi:acylphosphatase-1-like [Leptopilina heterotoma]|uniref:acylphosphatase-1-like n=1 Tax=Leptopilina heterotoma TaxID=63436 RepID=UPI001CA9964A|nr:acylphosphatase-1-like [Leptopilina heterotoma]
MSKHWKHTHTISKAYSHGNSHNQSRSTLLHRHLKRGVEGFNYFHTGSHFSTAIAHPVNIEISVLNAYTNTYIARFTLLLQKYTQREGKKLGLIGWCMNTDRGTVIGQLQGEKTKVHEMKLWLQHKGSPSSSIEKAEFRNEKEIAEYTMTGFSIKK